MSQPPAQVRILKLADNISIKQDGKNYMLFGNLNGDIYKLNEVSYKILSLCDGKNTDKDIIKNITNTFNAGREEAAKDFNDLIQPLSARRYISSI